MTTQNWFTVSSINLHRGAYTKASNISLNDDTQILYLATGGKKLLTMKSSTGALETGSVTVNLYPFTGGPYVSQSYPMNEDIIIDLSEGWGGVSLKANALIGTVTSQITWSAL